jgi:hypothetical protein
MIVEIICNGTPALPSVESTYDMATAAKTAPETTPPTAPRSSLAPSGSACLVVLTAMVDHLRMYPGRRPGQTERTHRLRSAPTASAAPDDLPRAGLGRLAAHSP